jgi:hypothetical protein
MRGVERMADYSPKGRLEMDDWYWACRHEEPAGDKFIIENGQDALWRRVRLEIDREEHCAWMAIHPRSKRPRIEDMLDLMLTVVPSYHVNHNQFVFEAAKIPIFAKFLRNGRCDLCNYVSNSSHPTDETKPEPYSDANMRRLGRIVSQTIGNSPDWF